ncbi:MAG: hypothetical protein ABW224_08450 [Kibdelosporangium sp.]
MRIRAAIATVLLGLTMTACSSDGGEAPFSATTPSSIATAPALTPVAVPTSTPKPKPVVSAQDFKVDLKVVSKQCFGSAGCNVTVEPAITYLGTLTYELACDLTYSLSGDESGETIETAEHVQGSSYRVQQTSLSTKSTKVVPAATMASVNCR